MIETVTRKGPKDYQKAYYGRHKAKILARQKTEASKAQARARHKNTYSKKRKSPEYRLKTLCRLHRITVEQFWKTFEVQKGKCATCRVDLDPYSRNTCRDHDHKTGLFRGLLCNTCNTLLGHLERLCFDVIAFSAYVINPPAEVLK